MIAAAIYALAAAGWAALLARRFRPAEPFGSAVCLVLAIFWPAYAVCLVANVVMPKPRGLP